MITRRYNPQDSEQRQLIERAVGLNRVGNYASKGNVKFIYFESIPSGEVSQGMKETAIYHIKDATLLLRVHGQNYLPIVEISARDSDAVENARQGLEEFVEGLSKKTVKLVKVK